MEQCREFDMVYLKCRRFLYMLWYLIRYIEIITELCNFTTIYIYFLWLFLLRHATWDQYRDLYLKFHSSLICFKCFSCPLYPLCTPYHASYPHLPKSNRGIFWVWNTHSGREYPIILIGHHQDGPMGIFWIIYN